MNKIEKVLYSLNLHTETQRLNWSLVKYSNYDEAVDHGTPSRIAREWADKMGRIAKDANLSATGRANEELKISREAYTAIKTWNETKHVKLTAHIDTLVSRTRKEPPKRDVAEAITREIRLSEIRRSFAGMDPLMVRALYGSLTGEAREAVETAPPFLLPATPGVREFPTFVPMIEPEAVQTRHLADVEAEFPEVMAEVAELENVRGSHRALAMAVQGGLREMHGPQIDPSTDLPQFKVAGRNEIK